MHIYFPSSDGFFSITKMGLVMHFPVSHDFCVLSVCVFVPFRFCHICHMTSHLSFFLFESPPLRDSEGRKLCKKVKVDPSSKRGGAELLHYK